MSCVDIGCTASGRGGIEAPAIGNCLLNNDAQNPVLARDYKDRFDLDRSAPGDAIPNLCMHP